MWVRVLAIAAREVVFLLLEFLLDFAHFFANAGFAVHLQTLAEHLSAKEEEEESGSKCCEAFRKQCGEQCVRELQRGLS